MPRVRLQTTSGVWKRSGRAGSTGRTRRSDLQNLSAKKLDTKFGRSDICGQHRRYWPAMWWCEPSETRYDAAFPVTQNICITFIQCWTNVFNVGPTLYNCYTNVSCLLGCLLVNASHAPSEGPALDWSEWSYGHVMIDVRAEGQPVSGSLTTDPHVLTPGQDDRFTGWTWYSLVTVQGHYQQQQVLSVQCLIQITDHMGSYYRTSYDISWIYRRIRIGRMTKFKTTNYPLLPNLGSCKFVYTINCIDE